MSDTAEAIGGQFLVDLTRPLPQAGGGLAAFVATDKRSAQSRTMALRVRRHALARARVLATPFPATEGLLYPIAHGQGPAIDGEAGYFVICPAPPGPPLSALAASAGSRAWTETALIDLVLRPAAQVLEHMRGRGLTHRAIRSNNVFQAAPGEPVVLGAAWASPAGMDQPALFEPPYSALCHPSGRGDGAIADDIYALGVLLLTLAIGPAARFDIEDSALQLRKLEVGSATALIGDARLPPLIGDLIRGMLAEDPEHRPSPALLLDPSVARSRKVAARPPRRAQRPLKVGSTSVSTARMLAYAITTQPDIGVQTLRGAAAMQWLRRDIGDPSLAVRLEELQRFRVTDGAADDTRADAAMMMRATALLDPLAPLCWQGMAIWPNGMGPALAAARAEAPETLRILEEAIGAEAVSDWAILRDGRCDFGALRAEARQWRGVLHDRLPAGGLPRLIYMLNPLAPCASPTLGSQWIARIEDLMPGLDATLTTGREVVTIDADITAFAAARSGRRIEKEINAMGGSADGVEQPLALLRLLTELQLRFHPRPLPAVAGWLVGQAAPLLARWKNPRRRAAMAERLQALSAGGLLSPMLAAIEDPASQAADKIEVASASAELARIDAELATVQKGAAARASTATRIGQEIAAGLGLTALAGVLFLMAFG